MEGEKCNNTIKKHEFSIENALFREKAYILDTKKSTKRTKCICAMRTRTGTQAGVLART